MAGCSPRRSRYSSSSASNSRSKALCSSAAAAARPGLPPCRRRPGLPGLLEPPAHQVDPLQALQERAGSLRGSGIRRVERIVSATMICRFSSSPAGLLPDPPDQLQPPLDGPQSAAQPLGNLGVGVAVEFPLGDLPRPRAPTVPAAPRSSPPPWRRTREWARGSARPGSRRPPPGAVPAGKPPPRFCRRSYLISRAPCGPSARPAGARGCRGRPVAGSARPRPPGRDS